jgi:hypothetical protein
MGRLGFQVLNLELCQSPNGDSDGEVLPFYVRRANPVFIRFPQNDGFASPKARKMLRDPVFFS